MSQRTVALRKKIAQSGVDLESFGRILPTSHVRGQGKMPIRIAGIDSDGYLYVAKTMASVNVGTTCSLPMKKEKRDRLAETFFPKKVR